MSNISGTYGDLLPLPPSATAAPDLSLELGSQRVVLSRSVLQLACGSANSSAVNAGGQSRLV